MIDQKQKHYYKPFKNTEVKLYFNFNGVNSHVHMMSCWKISSQFPKQEVKEGFSLEILCEKPSQMKRIWKTKGFFLCALCVLCSHTGRPVVTCPRISPHGINTVYLPYVLQNQLLAPSSSAHSLINLWLKTFSHLFCHTKADSSVHGNT